MESGDAPTTMNRGEFSFLFPPFFHDILPPPSPFYRNTDPTIVWSPRPTWSPKAKKKEVILLSNFGILILRVRGLGNR